MTGIIWTKSLAFLRRDLGIETSYKTAFAISILRSLYPLLSFFFVARLVNDGASPHLARYGGDYFEFVLIGIALSQLLLSVLRSYAELIRRAQTTGVLEAMLSTRTSPRAAILYSSAYSLLRGGLQMLIVFAVGGIFLGADFGRANLPATACALLLAVASFAGMGILGAATTLILKRGNPVELIVGGGSALLGGAFFPVALLPESVQTAAQTLPLTHALEATRLALFNGWTVSELRVPLAVLAGMVVVLLPLGLWAFGRAVERGRSDGTLSLY